MAKAESVWKVGVADISLFASFATFCKFFFEFAFPVDGYFRAGQGLGDGS
jgi:hypothetical protein